MERKIGEIFPCNGKWYQCLEGPGCHKCDFNIDENTCGIENPYCTGRSDKKDVIFKKLEKVGEPYIAKNRPTGRTIHFQRYKCYQKPIIEGNIVWHWPDDNFIDIEIKQKQEDMKEKNLNLKPFDLEAAKAGKPVCTRDGRKARIICFDRVGDFPIVALTDDRDYKEEGVNLYDINGKGSNECFDLMMLPEKKEGWVNVYKMKESTFGYITSYFDTEENAKEDKEQLTGYVATVKINWEE